MPFGTPWRAASESALGRGRLGNSAVAAALPLDHLDPCGLHLPGAHAGIEAVLDDGRRVGWAKRSAFGRGRGKVALVGRTGSHGLRGFGPDGLDPVAVLHLRGKLTAGSDLLLAARSRGSETQGEHDETDARHGDTVDADPATHQSAPARDAAVLYTARPERYLMTKTPETTQQADVRNLAIIAHVDHGKTTLIDGLLREAGSFREGEVVAERAMDSNDLERERGITITSKCTAITWKGTRINMVDTPGHADFGGEVERVLGMVDSVFLLVDAFEGPMPQTRFVTRKALALGLRPIVVINKIDRPGARPDKALDDVFDLFSSLGASDEQLDFPHVYASGREGYAIREITDEPSGDLSALLDIIVEHVPPPKGDPAAALCMQVATLQYDDYLGYLAIGRMSGGRCRKNDMVLQVHPDGRKEQFRVQKILGFQGLKKFELSEARAGDIAAISGMEDLTVGATLTSPASPVVLPPLSVDEPTITMDFMVNDGPFAGKEGKYVTSRVIRDRLHRETRSNIALRVEDTDDPAIYRVSGRGELHLSILAETMRREGYEFCVSQPQVIWKYGEPRILPDGSEGPGKGKPLSDDPADGDRLEPYEEVLVDVEEPYSGAVIQELSRRGAKLREMNAGEDGRSRMEFLMPSRGLIGYRSRFLTETRGTGLLFKQLADYGPYSGPTKGRLNGVLITQEAGTSNTYALFTLQERGVLFMGTGEPVYGGMIIGQNAREDDLVVNPCKAKKLNNIRTTAADEKLFLTPPRVLTLEQAMEFINNDELVELTPKSIRVRKRILDHNLRKRAEKASAS